MSTTTKLWATASKEWVIPSKPKPGRKPKKDVPQEDPGDSDDAKGRRIQNRAAQRAFRERKQSQLAELQARILSYEQGEIERNVALQNIAKRLKEENDKLRTENAALLEKVAKLEKEKQEAQQQVKEQFATVSSETNEKKRWRDESPVHSSRQTRKRSRTSATPPMNLETSNHPSPASTLVATPESTGVMSPHQASSSDVPLPPPMPQPTFTMASTDMDQTGLNNMLDFSSSMKVVSIDTSFPQFNCGFCTDTTPCVCRELALNQLNESVNQELMSDYKDSSYLNPLPHMPTSAPPKPSSSSSILENLPAYQPPVPLRRKSSKSAKPIFPVFPAESSSRTASTSQATCSGDPSNCGACGDDAFGKAFCSAIEETVNARTVCDNCPSRTLDGPLSLSMAGSGCCGKLMGCGSCPPTSVASATTVIQYEQESPQEYIPTNDAWQRIKEHPNVQFADLSLLAEVVASRSKCTGPRIIITPPPDHANNQAGQFTDPRVKQEAPRLVPQEILLECGRRRVREVHSEAVREALRLLDAKFT